MDEIRCKVGVYFVEFAKFNTINKYVAMADMIWNVGKNVNSSTARMKTKRLKVHRKVAANEMWTIRSLRSESEILPGGIIALTIWNILIE